ncbi:RidA family protein [Aquipuribacter sp. SD81]|uniref:RidA family protein n=1 Tax=Aquipuribacter sp. SD81 TaxID=3127703 RepID=UPI00301AF98E
MNGRRLVSSGGPWEESVGYSRAVRVGDRVWVAGTTAALADGVVGGDDPAAQAREAWRRVLAALEEAGAGPQHVVRTRTYLVAAADADRVGGVHGELFGGPTGSRPASTMVVVAALVRPDLLVEVEAEAVVHDT